MRWHFLHTRSPNNLDINPSNNCGATCFIHQYGVMPSSVDLERTAGLCRRKSINRHNGNSRLLYYNTLIVKMTYAKYTTAQTSLNTKVYIRDQTLLITVPADALADTWIGHHALRTMLGTKLYILATLPIPCSTNVPGWCKLPSQFHGASQSGLTWAYIRISSGCGSQWTSVSLFGN